MEEHNGYKVIFDAHIFFDSQTDKWIIVFSEKKKHPIWVRFSYAIVETGAHIKKNSGKKFYFNRQRNIT